VKLVGCDKLDEIQVCSSPTPSSCTFKPNLLSQGVRYQLVAFETLLEKYPIWQGKVALIQVGLQISESNEVAAGKVTDIVSHINSRFSTLTYQPVVFCTQDLTLSLYLALLTVADAFCVSSVTLRERVALRTHGVCRVSGGDVQWRAKRISEVYNGNYSKIP